MSDYDARRNLNSGGTMPRAPKKVWYNYQCVRCQKPYMSDFNPYTEPGAMSDKGYVCRACRKKAPSKVAAPPPQAVQIQIEDIMKGAAGK